MHDVPFLEVGDWRRSSRLTFSHIWLQRFAERRRIGRLLRLLLVLQPLSQLLLLTFFPLPLFLPLLECSRSTTRQFELLLPDVANER
jgi:hypothetical protein